MQGSVRLFILFQMLYGALLIGIHILLLSPPFNEPRCDWIPGSGPWLELLDLQWSLRIRGNGAGNWETPMLKYNRHGNFAGTVLGLIIGVLTFLLSLIADCSLQRSGQGRLQPLAKIWLGFTTLQVPAFFACNMGKLGTLCGESMSQHSGVINTGAPTLFPKVSGHCGVLALWFIEWTCMCSIIGCLGIWLCWSFVNCQLQADTEEYGDGYEMGEMVRNEPRE